MKKIIFSLAVIFATFFISGCAVQQENAVNSANGNSNTDAQNAFEMKSRCAGYRSDIEKMIDKTSWSSYFVDEIFYSPVKILVFTRYLLIEKHIQHI
jgi:hypothetical protein